MSFAKWSEWSERILKVAHFIWIIPMLFFSVFLSGCSNEQIYNSVTDDISGLVDGDSSFHWSPEVYLEWCTKIKWYAPIAIMVSIIIGVLMTIIFKKEKNMKKTGIFLFILGIPNIILIVVYGSCYLYGKLF